MKFIFKTLKDFLKMKSKTTNKTSIQKQGKQLKMGEWKRKNVDHCKFLKGQVNVAGI